MGKGLLAVAAIIALGCSVADYRAALEVPPPGAYYRHDGVGIHFKDIGRGKPLVFLHGFGASLDTWRFMVDPFKDNHRLVLLDLKGHGYSDRPRDSKYSLQDHAAVVVGLMNHLGLSHAVLVGHSLGSPIALVAALRAQEMFPDMIRGIVLITGSLDPASLPFELKLMRIPVLGWLMMKLSPTYLTTRLALRKSVYNKDKVTDSWVELYAKYRRIPGTDYALLKTARQVIPENHSQLQEELRRLKVPVLTILGEHDEVISRESGEEICKVLAQCSTAVVEGVGHIPHEEKPEKVAPLLREFLTEVFARAG